MAAFNKITAAVGPLLNAINTGADAWKIALSNASPVAKTTFVPGTDDLATGNGYTAGGNACTVTSSTATAGVLKLILASPAIWTSVTGNMGPFRYAILWDTTTSVPVGFWDYGSSITLNGVNGDTFQVTLDGANGVFQVT
jgi:hypothetical protein